MREIIFDTETTGLDPKDGHRVIEIGCIELINRMPTSEKLHIYINPEREVPQEAVNVHGLTTDFLSDKPTFESIVHDFIDFIDGATLVAHNAPFDMKFINWELETLGMQTIDDGRVVDTLQIARAKFPGSPNNLDALCKRLGVDNSARDLHGALLDAEILAEVYLELTGGRQAGLDLNTESDDTTLVVSEKKSRPRRTFEPTKKERAAHHAFLETINNAIWLNQKSNS